MDRRGFLRTVAAAPLAVSGMSASLAQQPVSSYRNLLVLIELKGGNDGLNTVVPYADESYYALRSRLAVARDQVVQIDQASGLHPSLKPLLPLWQARELAIVQGIGYPSANLSHFRSIEIWDTASAASQTLTEGWLAQAFAGVKRPADRRIDSGARDAAGASVLMLSAIQAPTADGVVWA